MNRLPFPCETGEEYGIYEPVPSPWGEGQGEGESETLAILYRENRWQSAQIKRGRHQPPSLVFYRYQWRLTG